MKELEFLLGQSQQNVKDIEQTIAMLRKEKFGLAKQVEYEKERIDEKDRKIHEQEQQYKVVKDNN